MWLVLLYWTALTEGFSIMQSALKHECGPCDEWNVPDPQVGSLSTYPLRWWQFITGFPSGQVQLHARDKAWRAECGSGPKRSQNLSHRMGKSPCRSQVPGSKRLGNSECWSSQRGMWPCSSSPSLHQLNSPQGPSETSPPFAPKPLLSLF